MLHVSASTSSPSAFASRKDVAPHSASHLSSLTHSDQHRPASTVLMIPLMNESHADLLMIPISDDKNRCRKPQGHEREHSRPSPSATSTATRTETPAAPTPPPKPQLPEGCQDWDSYISQRKSTATLPFVYEDEGEQAKAAPAAATRIQSPELNFKHSFEQLGWRDCLNKTQRKQTNVTTVKALRQAPPAVVSTTITTTTTTTTTPILLPLVYDATRPGNSNSGSNCSNNNNNNNNNSAASLHSTKRLSNNDASSSTSTTTLNASTTTLLPTAKRLSNASTHTAATVPCYLPSTVYKRLSGASTLTANTAATAPCYPGCAKRLSGASTLTFASTTTNGGAKPRSLRRINRARHLRAYYADGASALLRARRLSVGISSMQGLMLAGQRRRQQQQQQQQQQQGEEPRGRSLLSSSSLSSSLRGELCAPPPFPPPEKPLPKLPVVEVRELQTGERARWRELLLRGLGRREGSRRRGLACVR
ncbi:unnamed protein product [Discula destructiva]